MLLYLAMPTLVGDMERWKSLFFINNIILGDYFYPTDVASCKEAICNKEFHRNSLLFVIQPTL
ncbi:hypothetical protein BKM67_08925 [Streptococcus suis]|uniref:Uncharacterized protein n=1 Tax=Streptococcus suis TaxID=1307 RepID=A0AAD0PAP9_STRSU|nr:hypothetical protein BKM66_08385 [Streptococcus suis]AWX98157.1 hypothetical protein BKM67_08925 [Streptococcus suis]